MSPPAPITLDWRTALATSLGWAGLSAVLWLSGGRAGHVPAPVGASPPIEVNVEVQVPEEVQRLREEAAKLRALVEQHDRQIWQLEQASKVPK